MSQALDNDAIGPIVLINLFTVKPGRMDEFIALQKRNLDRSPAALDQIFVERPLIATNAAFNRERVHKPSGIRRRPDYPCRGAFR